MSYEEALNLFKRRNRNLHNNPPANIPERLKRQKTEIERNEMAINALEKQIPKKVIEYVKGRYCCPLCKAIRYSNAPYCEHCGQALDWGEEDG